MARRRLSSGCLLANTFSIRTLEKNLSFKLSSWPQRRQGSSSSLSSLDRLSGIVSLLCSFTTWSCAAVSFGNAASNSKRYYCRKCTKSSYFVTVVSARSCIFRKRFFLLRQHIQPGKIIRWARWCTCEAFSVTTCLKLNVNSSACSANAAIGAMSLPTKRLRPSKRPPMSPIHSSRL